VLGLVECLQPRLLGLDQIEWLRELQPSKVLRSIAPAPSQEVEERERRESWILAYCGPRQSGDAQALFVGEENVDEVSWLVASGNGQQLVDREIDRVQHQTAKLVAYERHESPRRVV